MAPRWREGECSLFAAVRAAEADSTLARATRPKAILLAATPLGARGGDRDARRPDDPVVEPGLDNAGMQGRARGRRPPPTAPFGPALPLEPIDSAGRINGDVVYVADLGDRNDVRRERFKDRTWYRLAIRSMANGSLRAEVVPY